MIPGRFSKMRDRRSSAGPAAELNIYGFWSHRTSELPTLGTQATCPSGFRPSRLPISASDPAIRLDRKITGIPRHHEDKNIELTAFFALHIVRFDN
jgi:hypothetical protein